ncbi:MAG: hypothetical protein IGS49_28005 [Chlorogloeopsis fritschii C42_A2020_084]|jgi:hypothetical protein|uniref:hypothetical protein n=1 Tax=Chlorogloeopsis fritschii TaxID=1124 RepID=UPI0019DCC29B|nr:hypothetical protein [Chlorogloeopsis fritschii]MBF2009182.1 hypothetical protein [Chlorogloeopsis fritschii C42_A2020_084]
MNVKLNVSELTNALDRIRAYLESNYPAVATQLPPGLPLEKKQHERWTKSKTLEKI